MHANKIIDQCWLTIARNAPREPTNAQLSMPRYNELEQEEEEAKQTLHRLPIYRFALLRAQADEQALQGRWSELSNLQSFTKRHVHF